MQGWKVLAQGGEGAGISRCPGGHIHLTYSNVTLHFTEEDFHAFAAMVEQAEANLSEAPLKGLVTRPENVAATFSRN